MKSFAMAVLLFSAAVAYPQSDAIGRVIQVPGHVPGVPASLGSSPVTGVPFSAEVVNQTTQVLQDGNPVRYQTRGKIFRDSTGRTRNEFSTRTALDNAAQISQQVIIDDPVAHVSIRFSILQALARTWWQKRPSSSTPDLIMSAFRLVRSIRSCHVLARTLVMTGHS